MFTGTYDTTAYDAQPLRALFHAQSTAASAMAVFLIGGGALTASALLGMAYIDRLQALWWFLPYAAMLLCAIWWGAGALLMRYLQHDVVRCRRHYERYLQDRASARMAAASRAQFTQWLQSVTAYATSAASEQQPDAQAMLSPLAHEHAMDLPRSLFGTQQTA